jgi:ABC-type amino acid transport substrate-binding protein
MNYRQKIMTIYSLFRKSLITLIFIISLGLPLTVYATDTVKYLEAAQSHEKRTLHKDEVLLRALQLTEPEFGDFTIDKIKVEMSPTRARRYIEEGHLINTFILPVNKKWEPHAIPIKIPLRLGLISYRLLLVNKEKLPLFKEVKTLEQLSQLTAGLQSGWVTTEIFNELGIKTVESYTFEGLFLMLNKQRFDYLPRAVYEIFDELTLRQDKIKNVVVEPNLALFIPKVTYLYVSKTEPRLAKRLKLGLEKLLSSGELKAILDKYYQEDIKRADLKNRTIIEIPNPYFTDTAVLKENLYWYKNYL